MEHVGGRQTWTFHCKRREMVSPGKRRDGSEFRRVMETRAAAIGTHAELFANFVGLRPDLSRHASLKVSPKEGPTDSQPEPVAEGSKIVGPEADEAVHPGSNRAEEKASPDQPPGVGAVDDLTLRVTLLKPDPDLPKLVADPVFRPVSPETTNFNTAELDPGFATNGPFTVSDVSEKGVVVQRSDTYWNKQAVKLERIRFIPSESAEAALAAYKNGDLDAITNSDFEPLALKLLTPYGDFRQTPHNALNLYEFNIRSAPFSDRRVREALAVAIDRPRVVESEFQGTAETADDFLPLTKVGDGSLDHDPGYGRELLSRAGYPNGANFPVVRLLINRNDVQQRIARVVARMWQQNLNIQTQIVVKDPGELDAVRASGEYDIIRRGAVFPTADQAATLDAIFRPAESEAVDLVGAALPGMTSQLEAQGRSDAWPFGGGKGCRISAGGVAADGRRFPGRCFIRVVRDTTLFAECIFSGQALRARPADHRSELRVGPEHQYR